ncbi:MAG TPA: uracil-DNA glycosylase [Bdellovibrionota bacterium]|jgi:uracil-DNA glycosylase
MTTNVNQENIKLEPEWKAAIGDEFTKPYMLELKAFLRQEAARSKKIYPRGPDIFNAFNHTPLNKVKAVILGQDPYHGPGQAHGLCFSVRDGVPPPPSLKNIFKEMHSDLGLPIPNTGNLTSWADQGVLLLNTVLTVEHGQAGSHRNRGWEKFTDRAIEVLSARAKPIVFLLWGNFAHAKAQMIQSPPHRILKAPHPSPLSAHNGFFGCRHFSQANALLKKWGEQEIDWSL